MIASKRPPRLRIRIQFQLTHSGETSIDAGSEPKPAKPAGDICVEPEMKLQIGITQNAPRSPVSAEFDAILAKAVVVADTARKKQTKRRQISHQLVGEARASNTMPS